MNSKLARLDFGLGNADRALHVVQRANGLHRPFANRNPGEVLQPTWHWSLVRSVASLVTLGRRTSGGGIVMLSGCPLCFEGDVVGGELSALCTACSTRAVAELALGVVVVVAAGLAAGEELGLSAMAAAASLSALSATDAREGGGVCTDALLLAGEEIEDELLPAEGCEG